MKGFSPACPPCCPLSARGQAWSCRRAAPSGPGTGSRRAGWGWGASPSPDCRAARPGSFLSGCHPSLGGVGGPPSQTERESSKTHQEVSSSTRDVSETILRLKVCPRIAASRRNKEKMICSLNVSAKKSPKTSLNFSPNWTVPAQQKHVPNWFKKSEPSRVNPSHQRKSQ